ncbi:MAG: class I SAM-dependent DNA methyltransferase, partial [Candidatus Hodarchaeota archaeon]
MNKLFVSLFVKVNNIKVNHNRLIKQLIISENNFEQAVFKEFRLLFERYENKIDFSNLVQLFEYSIPSRDRVINGIVYTPKYIKLYIVDEIINRLYSPMNQARFCDLSCGCGGFLYTMAKRIKNTTEKKYNEIFKNYLYGLDIKDYSIERAQILLSLLAISESEDNSDFEFNLYVGNALNFDWYERISYINQNKGFDAIVGNPPYVTIRNIDEESKRLLKNWSVTRGGNTDLYIPFFEIGINYLKQNGILGYITVNTFFRSLNARALRKYFHDNSFNLKIIDFGNERVFGNKSAYTCLCFIQKQVSNQIKYTKANIEQIQKNNALEFKEISYNSLDYNRGWLLCSNSILKKLKMIESIGTPLIVRFKMRTGLATLSNNIFIFKPFKEDDNFYFIKKGDNLFPIEKNVCKDIINPNKIKSDLDIPKQLEKIIFPYHKNKNRIELFNEDYFKSNFSHACKYLEIHKKILAKR